MSATDIGNALKRPALVWLKTFLRVEVDDFDGGSWSLATGQWVHRWLAVIGATPRANRFVRRPNDEKILSDVIRAAREFHDEVSAILRECERPLPDWWSSGWHNARFLAEQFATQLSASRDWPRLATEWKLESPQRIAISHDQELRVRGRVDLLLARGEPVEELWIVDYKTGEARPLASQPAKLQKQLAAGDGIQISLYALALRPVCQSVWTSLLARDATLEKQSSVMDVLAQEKLWAEIARMQRSGIFGMLGELRSDFSFTGTYPLATLAVDKFLLKRKWEKTHPAFAAEEE